MFQITDQKAAQTKKNQYWFRLKKKNPNTLLFDTEEPRGWWIKSACWSDQSQHEINNQNSARSVGRVLPGPVAVVLGPLLVGPGRSDLVLVLLVTDQIWTKVLAIFLNNCHSTRANGCLPPSFLFVKKKKIASAVGTFFFNLFPVDQWVRKKRERKKK